MTISLCVVVRNESLFLASCLESARPVVDEMVVVDTGSTDGTCQVARAAGARVIETGWPGDLGRAHNLPLPHARGDWVLSLDGDEVLDPAAVGRLRERLAHPNADAYRLPIRNYVYEPVAKMARADDADPLTRGALGYVPTAPVRLFRRHRSHRFSGLLHQTMAPAVLGRGGVVADLPVVIHHYGLLRVDRSKSTLYRTLARRQAEATPHDPRALVDFGLFFADRTRQAAALDIFRRARQEGPPCDASFYIGLTLLEMQQAASAVPFLLEALRNSRATLPTHFNAADAYELLGRAYEMEGRLGPAVQSYRRALVARPGSLAALVNLAGLCIDRGSTTAAAALVDRLLEMYPGIAHTWAALAALRLRERDVRGARDACAAALAIDPHHRDALGNLARAYARLGQPRLAAGVHRVIAASDKSEALAASTDSDPVIASPSRSRRLPPARRGIVSIVEELNEASTLQARRMIRASGRRTHVVLFRNLGGYGSPNVLATLRAEGIRAYAIRSDMEAVRKIQSLKPDTILHHRGGRVLADGPIRIESERWIAVARDASPMPSGYDDYVVFSEYQRSLQNREVGSRAHLIREAVQRHAGTTRRAPADLVTVAMVSSLDPGRFPRQLLEYLPRLDDLGARVLIAGRGARRYEIEPLVARRGLSNVIRFTGALPASQVQQFLAAADIGLCLTETAPDVSGTTVLAMMAAGLPIVAQPFGCLPELVRPENGRRADHPSDIAKRLEELIRSRALRQRMGAAGRRLSRAHAVEHDAAVRRLLGATRTRQRRRWPRPALDTPEQLTASTWRPSLSYLICCSSTPIRQRLSAALWETGIAGFPREWFGESSIWRRAHREGDEQCAGALAITREAGATPNGVFGASVSVTDLAGLVSVLDRLQRGAAKAGGPAAVPLPNLHGVCVSVDELDHGQDGDQSASCRDYFTQLGVDPIVIPSQAVVRDAAASARRILKWLGLGRSGAVSSDRRVCESTDASPS